MGREPSQSRGRRLRSQLWFDNPDNPGMTALYLERYLIPFPHQDDLTIYGNDVIDWTSFGLRSI